MDFLSDRSPGMLVVWSVIRYGHGGTSIVVVLASLAAATSMIADFRGIAKCDVATNIAAG